MTVTLDRRELLAGTAAGMSTVTLLCGTTSDAAIAGTMASPGAAIQTVLRVDDLEHRVSHDIRASLLHTLRQYVGLEGTERGCEHGECGACTVYVDGEARLACRTLTVALQGKEITTRRGRASGDPRSRVD